MRLLKKKRQLPSCIADGELSGAIMWRAIYTQATFMSRRAVF